MVSKKEEQQFNSLLVHKYQMSPGGEPQIHSDTFSSEIFNTGDTSCRVQKTLREWNRNVTLCWKEKCHAGRQPLKHCTAFFRQLLPVACSLLLSHICLPISGLPLQEHCISVGLGAGTQVFILLSAKKLNPVLHCLYFLPLFVLLSRR